MKIKQREFVLGVLWATWWLHVRGEDTYAEDLLIESVGSDDLERVHRLARRESYNFKRGFWPGLNRRVRRAAADQE